MNVLQKNKIISFLFQSHYCIFSIVFAALNENFLRQQDMKEVPVKQDNYQVIF